MSSYTLDKTSQVDLQTTFRFEIFISASDPQLGLSEDITGFIQKCDLPTAPGDPIVWSLPGGMRNYQAGKRTTQPISMEFVVPTTAGYGSVYTLLEKWAHATYNLNDGTNIGKANYCTDAIYIKIKGEDNTVKYVFQLKRAQVTRCNYGAVSSEDSNLLRVSCEFAYDNYKITNGTTELMNL